MVAAPQSFTLDHSVFNHKLYSHMRTFWFDGLSADASVANLMTMQRWFGVGKSDEEKAAFDEECRSSFGPALAAIDSFKLSLPPFKSYEDEIENADTIAAPLIAEVKEAQKEDEKSGARTLLSLLLLLDQMPRNIYRDPAGLRLIYGHYDRLAFSLLRSSLAMSPSPSRNEIFVGRPIYINWLLLPLVHSEHLPSHELWAQLLAQCRRDCQGATDEEAIKFVENIQKSGRGHQEPLERFGRYPHRNECLGRQNTPEETEYLLTADTYGVKQVQQQRDKSEL